MEELTTTTDIKSMALETISSNNELVKLSDQSKIGISLPVLFAKTKLSLTAQRIMRVVVSMIRPTDLPNRIYRFRLADFCKIYNLKSSKNYDAINEAIAELRGTFTLQIGKGRTTGWINWGQLTEAEVAIQFDPILYEFYRKELAAHYKLINVKGFVYSNTFKFYELFSIELRKHSRFCKEIEELREWLQLGDKYKNYADFKKRVLIPVVNDINGNRYSDNCKISDGSTCNLRVSFEEERVGKKVVRIWFNVEQVPEDIIGYASITLNEFYDNLSPDAQVAYQYFRDYLGVAHSAIVNSCNKYGEEYIIRTFYSLNEAFKSKDCDVHNKAAYAATCLRNGSIADPSSIDSNTEAKTIELAATDVIDKEREEILEYLKALGLNARYINKLRRDKTKSIALLKRAAEKYSAEAASNNWTPGWLHEYIENDWDFIDHANEVLEREARIAEEKKQYMTEDQLVKQSQIERARELANGNGQLFTDYDINKEKNANVSIEIDQYLQTASLEDKEKLRDKVIESLSNLFYSSLIAKYGVNDLHELSLDTLIANTNDVFYYSLEQTWVKEYR